MFSPLVIALCAAPMPVQDVVRPDAAALAEQGRQFVPQYEGDHKPLLSEAEERNARAGMNVLEAALALEPENPYALWWHGQACVLLGENERNRANPGAANGLYDLALTSFAESTTQAPNYYWAYYSSAMALANLERFPEAIERFDGAVRVTNAIMDSGAADDWAPFVRFKARQWRADAHLRFFDFERARTDLVSFYADNGNNQWDLGYSMADAFLRESDFASARAAYVAIAENAEFQVYDSTFAELAYIAGLARDPEGAVRRIRQALEKEFQPTLYPRLWLWLFADGELREKAAKDLAAFLEYPPATLSDWDRALGKFLIEGRDIGAFIELAESERTRRMDEGVALDDLMCEVWFYAAKWDERRGHTEEALASYRRALAFRPRVHKWEWSYARHGLSTLAAASNLSPDPGFDLDGTRIVLHPDKPLNGGPLSGELVRFTVHRAGDLEPMQPTSLEVQTLQSGDLLRCIIRTDDGREHAVRIVVG